MAKSQVERQYETLKKMGSGRNVNKEATEVVQRIINSPNINWEVNKPDIKDKPLAL